MTPSFVAGLPSISTMYLGLRLTSTGILTLNGCLIFKLLHFLNITAHILRFPLQQQSYCKVYIKKTLLFVTHQKEHGDGRTEISKTWMKHPTKWRSAVFMEVSITGNRFWTRMSRGKKLALS